jgi:hypothetical protein
MTPSARYDERPACNISAVELEGNATCVEDREGAAH